MSAAAKSTRAADLDEFFDDDDISVDSPRELSDTSSDNVSSAKEIIDLDDDIDALPDLNVPTCTGEPAKFPSRRKPAEYFPPSWQDSTEIKGASKHSTSEVPAEFIACNEPSDITARNDPAEKKSSRPQTSTKPNVAIDMNSKNRRKLRAILQ